MRNLLMSIREFLRDALPGRAPKHGGQARGAVGGYMRPVVAVPARVLLPTALPMAGARCRVREPRDRGRSATGRGTVDLPPTPLHTKSW